MMHGIKLSLKNNLSNVYLWQLNQLFFEDCIEIWIHSIGSVPNLKL